MNGIDRLAARLAASAVETLLEPRLVVCVAGHYPDGSHSLGVNDARAVIRGTRTRSCVFRAPSSSRPLEATDLSAELLFDAYLEPHQIVPVINTTGATDAAGAAVLVEQGLRSLLPLALERFAFAPLIKLEILSPELTVDDQATIACLTLLPEELRLRTLPIVNPSPWATSRVAAMGCPAVRVLSGLLRRQSGILRPDVVGEAIVAASTCPVVLEGGISSSADIFLAAKLGASAVLVNSAFALASDPLGKALELRAAADAAWGDGGGRFGV